MDESTVRLHNLLLRIYKKATKDGIDYMNPITKDTLYDLYFRQSDFRLISRENPYFIVQDDNYILTEKAQNKVEEYMISHRDHPKDNQEKDAYIQEFKQLKDIATDISNQADKRKYSELSSGLADKAVRLHWSYQPEYEEYLLVNTGQLPEDDLRAFYDNYFAFEDLYWVLTNAKEKKDVESFLGDKNLDKKFKFKVYSKRWGHEDTYDVERTLDGWAIHAMAVRKSGNKHGSSIIEHLKHDSICYPHNVESYIYSLWLYADRNPIEVSDLEDKMKEIADWISQTERNRPGWILEDN
ncbi:MAG: hypothetical protein WCX83_03690 [Candidatus Cloacimonas sp.]